jgi:hypothetical protein
MWCTNYDNFLLLLHLSLRVVLQRCTNISKYCCLASEGLAYDR